MKDSIRIQTAFERKPIHPETIRGHARQISFRCVNREIIRQLGGKSSPSQKQVSGKEERLKLICKISRQLNASLCAQKVHPQASRADWLVLMSDGDGAIDIVHFFLSLKATKTIEFSSLTVASFSKHCMERFVERGRIRNLVELVSTIEPVFGWLQQANCFMPPNGALLPLPLPDGLLCLRRNAFGEAPTIVTAINQALFSQESQMQWRGLFKNSEMFDHSPELFKEPENLSMKHFIDLLVMDACGVMSDILKELRGLTP